MKFKVGDKVRVTREWLAKQAESSFVKSYEVSWWEIKKIVGDDVYCPNNEYWYEEKYLELVPEEEFERWEIVEVWSAVDGEWFKTIFLWEITWAKHPYICLATISKEKYLKWEPFVFVARDKIRKPRRSLTRKEIAEKFWIEENFEFVED